MCVYVHICMHVHIYLLMCMFKISVLHKFYISIKTTMKNKNILLMLIYGCGGKSAENNTYGRIKSY